MKAVLLIVGALLLLLGAVWTGQGLGYIGGSFMTGDSKWTIIGLIVAVIGIALGIVGLRRRAR